jgi:hypothetical protein
VRDAEDVARIQGLLTGISRKAACQVGKLALMGSGPESGSRRLPAGREARHESRSGQAPLQQRLRDRRVQSRIGPRGPLCHLLEADHLATSYCPRSVATRSTMNAGLGHSVVRSGRHLRMRLPGS